MDEFGGAGQLGVVGDLFLHPVLDGLDVMVGDALDVLDAGGVGLGEAFHQLTQALARALGKAGSSRQAGVGQGHQPGSLDLDAVGHEAGFRTAGRAASPGMRSGHPMAKGR